MSLFSKLFGGTPDYPPLPPGSPLGARIHDLDEQLTELTEKVNQPLEVLPLPNAAYVFIGKPPKKFGMAWVHDGEVSGFQALVQEQGVSPAAVEDVVTKLQDAYSAAEDAKRFTTQVGGETVVVTDAPALTAQVDSLVRELIH